MRALVSCLCVTGDREAFMPWLLWCFDRQTWPTRELIIVDSSSFPFVVEGRSDIRVIPTDRSASVPEKRNLALRAARGPVVAWFDDDDWQHPARIEQLLVLLDEGTAMAGPRDAWIIELLGLRAWLYPGFSQSILFNGSAFLTETARAVTFDPRYRRASDTVWLSELRQRRGVTRRPPISPPTFFWLRHLTNLSINPERGRLRRILRETSLADVRSRLGTDAWGDTDNELEHLRERLAHQC